MAEEGEPLTPTGGSRHSIKLNQKIKLYMIMTIMMTNHSIL